MHSYPFLRLVEQLTIRARYISGMSNPVVSRMHFRMNALNRARLKSFINSLSPGGSTDFEAGFTAAFNIIDSAERRGSSSNCQSVILFMTDGNAPDPTMRINSRNGGPYGADNPQTEGGGYTRIFTYAFGSDDGADTMKSIACNNGGVYHEISDADGPRLKEIMANYFVLSHFPETNASHTIHA
eukprot:COSAG02_NODE_5575_length_4220_cov_7.527057_4_plen_184_part_00